MTEIIPFRGLYFDNQRVTAQDVTAPPYDVITHEARRALYERSDHNIVRVDFGEELPGDGPSANKYTRAAALMSSWLSQGLLKRHAKPAFFVYRIGFSHHGKSLSVTGIFGLVRLTELGKGVYPHEATHSKPKQDRRMLMEATSANTSPIYALYDTPEAGAVAKCLTDTTAHAPYHRALTPEGVHHEMWILDDDAQVATITKALSNCNVFIADGHHRYETALDYQRAHGGNTGSKNPADYVMMFLADVADPGLLVLPTHRIVTLDVEGMLGRLAGHFDITTLAPDADVLSAIEGSKHTFGLYADGRKYVLHYKGGALDDQPATLRDLDVVVLHKLVFGKLLEVGSWGYEMSPALAMDLVERGEYDAAFFLNPTSVGNVREVALSGLRMPPKSTFFHPKAQTGLVMNGLVTEPTGNSG